MSIPKPEHVIAELVSLFPLVQEGLEYGTECVRSFFQRQDSGAQQKVDPYLASTMVRYYLRDYLRNAETREAELTIDHTVANIGLHLKYGQYQIKILKSRGGEIPVPGHSKRRRDYYDQPHLNLFAGDASNPLPLPVNLLLLWDVRQEYELGVISLACPKSGGTTKDTVSAYWHCMVPHRLFLGGIDPNLEISSDEIMDLHIEDIQIDTDDTELGEMGA